MATVASICTGCSSYKGNSESKDSSTIKIGVSIYNEYDTYIASYARRMSEWCKNKEKETGTKIMLEIVSAKGSQLTQNDQVEKFIAREFDVVCVNLVDRTDATMIIDAAKSADIPVIFFNRELVKEDLDRWDKLYYVGAKAEQSGKLQAQIITDMLRDKASFDSIDINHNGVIQYVMLEGEAGHQDSLVRTRTCIEEIKKAGFSLEKIGDEIANWDRDQAKTQMKSLLERYPIQIEMVIANNDDMALGALQAIEEFGPNDKMYVVGINGTEEALEAVRTQKLGGTVYNDAIGQARCVMSMAFSLATEGSLPDDIELIDGKYVYLPYEKITYDNVRDYIKLVE